MRKIFFVSILLLLVVETQAQSNRSLQLSVNYDTLGMNEILTATYTFTGSGDNIRFIPPSFKDFTLVGSSSQNSFNMVNGRMSSTMSYVYQLRPLREGNCKLPAAEMNTGGKDHLKSNEQSVYVLKEYFHKEDMYSRRSIPNYGYENIFPSNPDMFQLFQFPDINTIFNDPFFSPHIPNEFHENRPPQRNMPSQKKEEKKSYKL